MQSSNSSSNNEGNIESAHADKDATATEKKKLLREIQELKCIIKQCEWNLQTLHFKDVEGSVTERPLQRLEVSSRSNRIPRVEVDLQYDLYRFAGFQCVKFGKDEFVFNFVSTNEEQKDNTHAVQFFMKDKKGHLGKWVMPMSIDMKYILSKAPIENLKNITAFMKSCKHHIDCYTVRQEQFLSLKKHIANKKHWTLQSDMGFKQINLELYGVHDNESDTYINLMIYLLYHSEQARPYKIEIDTINKSKLSNDAKQRLKVWLKEFKMSDLQTAFDKIIANDNSTFTWTQADDSESPLELNDTSSSDENLLVQLKLNRKRSLRKLQKKRKLKKKWNERKRQRINTIVELSEEDQEDSYSKEKVSRTESPQQILIKKKKTKPSILKQRKMNKSLVEETTPLHKPNIKLKQTRLNFLTHENRNSNANEMSVESKLRNRLSKQLTAELITSTPLRKNVKSKIPLSPNLENNNITFIKTMKKMENKLNDSKDSNQLDNKKTSKKNNRLLQSSLKTTRLSNISKSKSQRVTRSKVRK